MNWLDRLVAAGLRRHAERGGRGRSLQELRDKLAAGNAPIVERMAQAADTPAQRRIANHVYGIEGWGQARLRVALGEPLVLDVHQDYLLPDGTPPTEVAEPFRERRAATVALVDALIAAGVEPTTTVMHNGLGDLSVAGWLAYLDQHAERESRYGLRKRAEPTAERNPA